jgi:hypothetical protein
VSIPDDADSDLLISRLAGPLTPDAVRLFAARLRTRSHASRAQVKGLLTGPSLRFSVPILTRRLIIARAGTLAVNHA